MAESEITYVVNLRLPRFYRLRDAESFLVDAGKLEAGL